MTDSTTDRKFEQVARRFEPQSKLIRAWELKGGVSAQVTALQIERSDGETKKLVVRRHGPRDLEQNPNIASDEFRLLEITRASGLQTPMPYQLDTSCEIFPTPYIVLDYIDGETEVTPSNLDDFNLELATQLSSIHSIDCSTLDLSFLPNLSDTCAEKIGTRPAKLDESIGEGRIRDTLESLWPWPQRNESVLLHGDFWPGNVLWLDGRVAAVIDWEDAQLGDPLADLSNTRLEILWAFGIDAMNLFTDHYQSVTPLDFTTLPYWDMHAALKPAFRIDVWTDDEIFAEEMRERHRLFVAQALEKLPT
ncbi:MAG: phosphotransferase [SAR202 cluster bacterium]|nr:phosphotransferase [SAR202 cluster bacterium]